jgi:CubicO group peptidase (beta-lactamase class C family)
MQFKEKVITVTGGAAGIGRAMCRRFAAEGARGVVVADLDDMGAAADGGGAEPRLAKILTARLLAAIVTLVLWEAVPSQSKATEVVQGTVKGGAATKIDKRFSELAKKNFSGVALVVQDGEVLLAKGYGFADRVGKTPYTTDTVFDIGSITKPFTASAVLKLEMDDKLKITDSITKFWKDVPEDKREITLHHLLTHTAGFKDSLGGDYEKIDRGDFVTLALASKLRSKPGTTFSYSNVGYSLLGAVIERVTGGSYETYLHDRLFKPAGMTKTGYALPNWGKSELARGYQIDKDWGTPLNREWAEDGPYWHLRANGGLLSTVGDLYRWSVALREDEILSIEAKQKQFTPHVSEGLFAGGNHYGYGWSIGKTQHGTPAWEHNGSNGVFFADLRIYPEDRLVLVFATNASGLKYMSELNNVARDFLPALQK